MRWARRNLAVLLTVLLSGATVPRSLGASAFQCPDGAPPPCGPPRAPPDRNVIAILPFRVSGADPALAYLANGMPELLAGEFDGEGGPAAIEPGTVLRAWARASRGVNADRRLALQLAGALGAGQALLGAVVGSMRRVNITASIVDVPDGRVRVAQVTVAGPPDSLTALLSGLAARLLSRQTGAWRLSANDPGTTSNEALRFFLTGISAYRTGRYQESSASLSRALGLDSSFALAAYWLLMTSGWGQGVPDLPDVQRLAWRNRDRLGHDRRVLLEAFVGRNTARERAVALLPGSAEAWLLLGESYFHSGAQWGFDDWRERGRVAMERSLAIDTTLQVLDHLAILAFSERDMTTHARWLAVLERRFPQARTTAREHYAASLARGLPPERRRRRDAYVARLRKESTPLHVWSLPVAALPFETDTILAQLDSTAASEADRREVTRQRLFLAANHGRGIRDARRAWFGTDTLLAFLHELTFAEHDSGAAERLARATPAWPDSLRGPFRCEVILSRLRRGDTTGLAAELQLPRIERPAGTVPCIDLLSALAAGIANVANHVVLLRMDSILRTARNGVPAIWNYDLALAFAKHHRWHEAAAAARRHPFMADRGGELRFGASARLPLMLRDEGRWSVLAGDTTNAIRAFRHYLALREDPEPVMIFERDSIRAELARLEQRRP